MTKNKEYILCAAIWYKDLPMKKPEILDNRGFRPYNVDKGVFSNGIVVLDKENQLSLELKYESKKIHLRHLHENFLSTIEVLN